MAKLAEYGFDEEESYEEAKDIKVKTGYPAPVIRRRIFYESYNQSIEEIYYWVADFIRVDLQCPQVDKIADAFAASEQSAFFGAAQSRLGIQQDKVSQFLATIGKMVKELFQLVRELRILDERMRIYADSYKEGKLKESAEITLKGIWVDMVEGGGKNPSSVYGMATELQFTSLPDLFYSIHPENSDKIEETVDKKAEGFNRKVKEVLKRKLKTFMIWKDETYKEIKAKRLFTLKYLRQHYDIIKMYMVWVKPYLRNIKRLQMADKTKKIDMIAAFEGSIVEIEILGKKKSGKTEFYPCVLVSFDYRTKPSMDYHQEGYQHRGPLHIGRVIMDFRAYAWTDIHVKNYIQYKDEEDMDLLKTIDSSVKAAYDALGDDLQRYLEEAGEKFDKPLLQKEEKPAESFADKFDLSVLGWFLPKIIRKPVSYILGDVFREGAKTKDGKVIKKPDMYKLAIEKDKAGSDSKKMLWKMYDKFKKSHKMLAW